MNKFWERKILDKAHDLIERRKAGVEEGRLEDSVLELWEKNEMNRKAVADQTVGLLAIWGEIALMKEARKRKV